MTFNQNRMRNILCHLEYKMTMNSTCILSIIFYAILVSHLADCGVLYPRPSETREVSNLNGLWSFDYFDPDRSDPEKFTNTDLNIMPVPSSYNDISTQKNLRDYVGTVVYSRGFFVPKPWRKKRVWIRFGSVCYNASVGINGKFVVHHEIGHYPFQAEITPWLKFGHENNVVVFVDNTLTNTTIPQGNVKLTPSGKEILSYTFDYFPYAGIDRSVYLYTTNKIYVDDITIQTAVSGSSGIVTYNIVIVNPDEQSTNIRINTTIIDRHGKEIVSNQRKKSHGGFVIPNATFWWPYLMEEDAGYLYTLRVDLINNDNKLVDRYDQKFGIRELIYNNDFFKINGRNIYIRGFGRHEDSDIRGKGLDLPLIIRDHNLIKWIGANAYRTSHYPYAEEIMDLADQIGIMIIDEVPAINTIGYSNALLVNHKKALTELYQRDKNRPSVVIWSVANEPNALDQTSEDYYRDIVAHIKSYDTSRPVSSAIATPCSSERIAQFLDIVSFNRYQGWYANTGETDAIYDNVVKEAYEWRKKHNKPVMMSEYGADAMEGLHILPQYVWTEEYQRRLMSEHFRAFDHLRAQGWFIGEMIWNFADFKTKQDYTRVGGNKKGVFTRNRQPKSSAFLLRRRYWGLATDIDHFPSSPRDLKPYILKYVEHINS